MPGNPSPLAIIIEVFVADDITGNIASGPGMLLAFVTGLAPVVESVRPLGTSHIESQRIRAGNTRIFTRVQMEVAAAAGGLAFSLANGYVRGLAFRIDIKAVFTGALHGERKIGRVDFEGIAAVESPQADAQRPLGKLNLHV